MPTYVSLIKLTQQGISEFKGSPSRAEAFKKTVKEKGGEVKGVYWTMGQYDGVLVFEMPSAEAAAGLMLETGKLGNISTETLRAFTEEEFSRIAGSAG